MQYQIQGIKKTLMNYVNIVLQVFELTLTFYKLNNAFESSLECVFSNADGLSLIIS